MKRSTVSVDFISDLKVFFWSFECVNDDDDLDMLKEYLMKLFASKLVQAGREKEKTSVIYSFSCQAEKKKKSKRHLPVNHLYHRMAIE